MPLRSAPRRSNEQTQRICELITNHEDDNKNIGPDPIDNEDDVLDDPHIDESDLWLVKYDDLAQKSKNIPLSHMGCCKEGADLFRHLIQF